MKTWQLWCALAAGFAGSVLLGVIGVVLWGHFHHVAPAVISVPASLSVAPRVILTIPVTGTGKQIHFACMEDHCTLIPWPNGDKALFIADSNGVYHVGVFGLDKGNVTDLSVCVITVSDGPAPGPKPDPKDPLTASLQKAYQASTEADKAASVAALGELYVQGAQAAQSRTDLSTWGDLFNVLDTVAHSVNVWGKIMPVQQIAQVEMKKAFPVNSQAAFDTSARSLAKTTLTALGNAVKAIVP